MRRKWKGRRGEGSSREIWPREILNLAKGDPEPPAGRTDTTGGVRGGRWQRPLHEACAANIPSWDGCVGWRHESRRCHRDPDTAYPTHPRRELASRDGPWEHARLPSQNLEVTRGSRPARVTRTAHCSMGVILELGVFELYISFNIYIVPAHDVAVWCDDRRGPVEPHRPRRRAPPRSGGVRSEPACGLCREGDPQTGPCSEGASSGGLPWELWVHAAR